MTELELQFLSRLDGLLKRKVLTEAEFARANEVARWFNPEAGGGRVQR